MSPSAWASTSPPQPHGGAPASLPGDAHSLLLGDGHRVALYSAGPPLRDAHRVPLLLVHSVNATASAFEMLPVFQRQARQRGVVALDLPGFGLSDKVDHAHSPREMRAAITGALDWMQRHGARGPIDVMALSLGCEFATEAVLRQPERIRSLTLISPTGMESRRTLERFEDGRTRQVAWLHRLLRGTRIGRWLYRALTSRGAMRWFLSRAWGGGFDPRLLEHGRTSALQPGAEFAPLDFVSGALFTRGVIERYRTLPVPLWVAHGTRGSFTDFGACPEHTGDPSTGAVYPVERSVFEGGAMPHFEHADAFDAAYERFLQGQALPPLGGRASAAPRTPPHRHAAV